jgi:HSP20 family protein
MLMAHIFLERRQRDDLRRLTALFDDEPPGSGAAGECVPPCDVIETAGNVEIVMDLPGVSANDIKILFSRGTVVIAGRKVPAACAHGEAAFHLAERSFGRFARAVRLGGAFDAGRASASLSGGELRVVLPRIEERRGRDIRIPLTYSPVPAR